MKWVIYCHINKINSKRYIGTTCQKKAIYRWCNGRGYHNQTRFADAIKAYTWENFEHIILEDNIETLEEAATKEKYWITYYHTWIYDPECWGYNATQGGEGSVGYKHSEESKLKIGLSAIGRNCKKVICIETGIIYDSLDAAAVAVGISRDMISLVANKHNTLAGGYHWAFADDAEQIEKLQTVKGYIKKKGPKQRRVKCIETNEIFEYEIEASEKYNAYHIHDCCKGKRRTSGGYHWEYVE